MRGYSRRGSRAPSPTPPPESHLNPARPAAAPGLPKAELKQPSGWGRATRHCHCSCRSRPRPVAMDTQRRSSSSRPPCRWRVRRGAVGGRGRGQLRLPAGAAGTASAPTPTPRTPGGGETVTHILWPARALKRLRPPHLLALG